MKKTFDASLQLKDSYALTATAAAQVSSAAKVVDLGPGQVTAKVVHNVTAANVSAAANKYTLDLQASNDSTFATVVVSLGKFVLGHATALGESSARSTGTFEQPFTNNVNGTNYRYVRQYVTIAGSPVTITHHSFMAKAE